MFLHQFLHQFPQPLSSQLTSPLSNRIALISVDGDPAAGIGQAGGQSVYVREIGQALAGQGWQVDLFTRRTSPTQPAIVHHSDQCRTIRLTAGPQTFIRQDGLFRYLPEFVQEFQAFQRQEGQYALVHTVCWLSAWVGMALKQQQPLIHVHTPHATEAIQPQNAATISPVNAARLTVEKAYLEKADCIVATSPRQESHLRTLTDAKERVCLVPCGVDLYRFGRVSRQLARHRLGMDANAPVVLFVGRFDPREGIATLVRSIARSQFCQYNLKLIIAGSSHPNRANGIERERIGSLVSALGLDDCTDFPIGLDEMLPLYYAAADVCVIPSYQGSFGLVALEALASRTPVVASQIDALQFTVIPEVTGLLVSPHDDEALADAIDRILGNPNWRDQLGGAGRVLTEIGFGWEVAGSKFSQLYNALLSQAAPSNSRLILTPA